MQEFFQSTHECFCYILLAGQDLVVTPLAEMRGSFSVSKEPVWLNFKDIHTIK